MISMIFFSFWAFIQCLTFKVCHGSQFIFIDKQQNAFIDCYTSASSLMVWKEAQKVFSKHVGFAALFDRQEHAASRLCPRLPEGAPQSCVRQQRQAVQIAVCLPKGAVHQHTAPAGSTSTLLRYAPAAINSS